MAEAKATASKDSIDHEDFSEIQPGTYSTAIMPALLCKTASLSVAWHSCHLALDTWLTAYHCRLCQCTFSNLGIHAVSGAVHHTFDANCTHKIYQPSAKRSLGCSVDRVRGTAEEQLGDERLSSALRHRRGAASPAEPLTDGSAPAAPSDAPRPRVRPLRSEVPEDFPLERSLLLLASLMVFAVGFWALQHAQLGGDPNDPAKVLLTLAVDCTRRVQLDHQGYPFVRSLLLLVFLVVFVSGSGRSSLCLSSA